MHSLLVLAQVLHTVFMPEFSHLVLLLRHLSHAIEERILTESGRRPEASALPLAVRGPGVCCGDSSTVDGEAWFNGDGCCKKGDGGRSGGWCV